MKLVKSDKLIPNQKTIIERVIRYYSLPTIRKVIKQNVFNISQALPYSTKFAIKTTIEKCKQAKCKPIFVFIPNSEFWSPDSRTDNYRKQLKNFIEKNGEVFIDSSVKINKMNIYIFQKSDTRTFEVC